MAETSIKTKEYGKYKKCIYLIFNDKDRDKAKKLADIIEEEPFRKISFYNLAIDDGEEDLIEAQFIKVDLSNNKVYIPMDIIQLITSRNLSLQYRDIYIKDPFDFHFKVFGINTNEIFFEDKCSIILKVQFDYEDGEENNVRKLYLDHRDIDEYNIKSYLKNTALCIANFDLEDYRRFTEYFDSFRVIKVSFEKDKGILYLKLNDKNSDRFVQHLLCISKDIRSKLRKTITFYSDSGNKLYIVSRIDFLRYNPSIHKTLYDENGNLLFEENDKEEL